LPYEGFYDFSVERLRSQMRVRRERVLLTINNNTDINNTNINNINDNNTINSYQ
jgi:hypothetical protein